MTNRKSSATGNAGDSTANAQENLNALFTAHQVHTLANLIYRQMTAGAARTGQPAAGYPAAPWTAPGAPGMQFPQGFMAPHWSMPGAAPMQMPFGFMPHGCMAPGAAPMQTPFGFAPHEWMMPGAAPMQGPFGVMPHHWMTPGAAMQPPQGFSPMTPSPAPSACPTGGAGLAAPPALFYWYP